MSHNTLRSAAAGHGHIIQKVILFLLMSIILTLLTVSCGRPQGVVIDSRYSIPDDPREFYSRYVNFRPGNGETVKLNPPRFSWTYLPDVIPESLEIPGKQLFT